MDETRRCRGFLVFFCGLVTVGASCTFSPNRSYETPVDGGPMPMDAARDVPPVDHTPPPPVDASTDTNCTPVSCTPAGGQYCGKIGDGCNRNLDCGNCPGHHVC